jgi:hypothetical protein
MTISSRGLALTVILLAGCHSWRVAAVTPEQLLAGHPKVVRVERIAGGQIDLAMPEVRGDTLVGRVAAYTVAIPLREIRTISVKRTNIVKSLLLGITIAAAALAAGLAILLATCDCWD